MASGNLYANSVAINSWPSEFASQGALGVMNASDGDYYGGTPGTSWFRASLTASGETVTTSGYGSNTAMTIPTGEGVKTMQLWIYGENYYDGSIRIDIESLPTDVSASTITAGTVNIGHDVSFRGWQGTSTVTFGRPLTAAELANVRIYGIATSGQPGFGESSRTSGQYNFYAAVTTAALQYQIGMII